MSVEHSDTSASPALGELGYVFDANGRKLAPAKLQNPDEPKFNRHGYPFDRTGLDAWSLTLKRENDKKMKLAAAKKTPPLREQEIVEMGHEVEISEVSKRTTVGKIAHLAAEYGWLVKVGRSKYRTADRMWKGEVKEGEIKTWYFTQALSPDRKHHISVSTEMLLVDGWVVDDVDEVKIHIVECTKEEEAA